MPRFDVVLFDADDTLFDFQKSEDFSFRKTFLDCGLSYGMDIKRRYDDINGALWDEYNRGAIAKEYLEVTRFQRLFGAFGITRDPDQFNEIYLTNLAENSFLLVGVEEVCRALYQECRLAIVTNAVSRVAHRKIEKSSLGQYISDVFVSDDIGVQKPMPEFFDHVVSRLRNYDKSRMIVVGDSLTSDIQGGANSGLATCWFNPLKKPNSTPITPTYEIRMLAELLPIVGVSIEQE